LTGEKGTAMRSNRTPDAFETAPTVVGPIPTPIEDEDTRPQWYTPPRLTVPNRGLQLAPRDRKMLRGLLTYVGTNPAAMRPGAVARACRTVLRHFSGPADLRDAALAFLADEAVRLDAREAS
jgi:hypothetical protein